MTWNLPKKFWSKTSTTSLTEATSNCNGLARRGSKFRFFDDSDLFQPFFGTFSASFHQKIVTFSASFPKNVSKYLPNDLDASKWNPNVWQMFLLFIGQFVLIPTDWVFQTDVKKLIDCRRRGNHRLKPRNFDEKRKGNSKTLTKTEKENPKNWRIANSYPDSNDENLPKVCRKPYKYLPKKCRKV